MKKFLAIAISVATALSGALPARALPLSAGSYFAGQSDVVPVRDQPQHPKIRERQRYNNQRYWKGKKYSNRHGRSYDRRHYHRHYNDNDNDIGLLFGGLAAGALIGGILAQPRAYGAPAYVGNAHTSWCYARYRSYRASDNTFQPYSGGRRQCLSPYN